MKQLLTFLLFAVSTFIRAQAPQSIPYQAVVRNTDGSVMAGTSITMTFKIHDVSAAGTIVYEETHSATSNTQGLVTLNVGAGSVVTGTFASINWGSGAKFLHVLMNSGSGNVDLGTQQMMSVPYALYAEKSNTTNLTVSTVGDTLYLGNGNFILIPGISNSNKTVDTGLGNQLLPGVSYCADKTISASGCDGLTNLDYQGYTYDLVEIAGQCWFKENLRASSFNDGTPITFEPNNSIWFSQQPNIASQPYYGYNQNLAVNQGLYGNFYNGWCLENQNLCPIGWHIPTICDAYYLFSNQGVSNRDILTIDGYFGLDANLAQKLISNDNQLWNSNSLNFIPSNSSGFTVLPGGTRSDTDGLNGYGTSFWFLNNVNQGSPPETDIQAYYLVFSNNVNVYFTNAPAFSNVNSNNGVLQQGRYVRCIKD